MKIVFTGGGTGGHFFPLIAVAESLDELAYEEKYVQPKKFYFGPSPYDEKILFDSNISFRKVVAGKRRIGYGAWENFLDLFVMGWGVLQALWYMYRIFPDVVFSKGSYTSFPTLLAARIFGIPVIIHESDSKPGRVSSWSAKFAKKIAVSYPSIADSFDLNKVAVTGNPIRKELRELPPRDEAVSYFELEPNVPTVLVLGGSQGAQRINDAVLGILSRGVETFQVIHQTGKAHFEEIEQTKRIVLEYNPNKHRYKNVSFLDINDMRYAAAAADIVITRAGSALFEIALWGIPAIVIPIPEPTSHDQRTNAYSYIREGAGVVIEEGNLTSNILLSQIHMILSNESIRKQMGEAARGFAREGASRKIARALLDVGMRHDKKP